MPAADDHQIVILPQHLSDSLHPTLSAHHETLSCDTFLAGAFSHVRNDFVGMIHDRTLAVILLKQHLRFCIEIRRQRRKNMEEEHSGRIGFS